MKSHALKKLHVGAGIKKREKGGVLINTQKAAES